MELNLRCGKVSLSLNPKKFQFKVKKVTWIGQLLNRSVITPRPFRLRATAGMNPLQDAEGVQRFLGMCNCLSRFTPDLADTVRPATELILCSVTVLWHNKVLTQPKVRRTANTTIDTEAEFFQVNKPCALQMGAIDTVTGPGALLKDDQLLTVFTSSTLSGAKVNYVSNENECLAAALACIYEVLSVFVPKARMMW